METSARIHPDDLAGLLENPEHFRFQRGMQLVVGTEEWRPHMQLTQEVPGGPIQYQGSAMELLLVLAHSMNFTYVLERPRDRAWGARLANGTFTGMVGMVQRQEADMALGPFGITAERANVVDCATPLYSSSTLLMAARGRPEVDPWSFLLPFSPSLWAATLGGLGIVVAATVMLLTTRTQVTRPIRETLRSLWQVVLSLVFVYCGILFQQGVEARHSSKGRRWVARLVVMGWAYTAMVLAWAYMGGLTSLLAVRHMSQPFQTLASLGNHPSMLLVAKENTAEAHLLQTGGPGVLRGLEKVREEDRLLWVEKSQYHNVFLPIANGKPWVVLVPDSMAAAMSERHFSLTGRCDYYTSREALVSYTLSIILQKNSPLLRAVNARLQAVTQGGLYTHWLKAAVPNASYCRHPPSVITVQDTFSLANLWGVFSVLAGGLGASLLVFFCELITSPRREATE